ncbi:MAG: CDP-alcohol phosphatidyltransferase family protein [Thermoleophilia bacterium]|nr:CDP-alcohol phosphatidyltransferase family protein [Thermoleophilia bacterium]
MTAAAHPLHWLPNALTMARLVALPVLLWIMLAAEGPTSTAAAVLFTLVALTDFVDGRLARRWDAESRFGRLADPLADRLLVGVGLAGLIILGRYPWPGPVIIIARDVLSVLAFVVLARRGVVLRVDMAGKVSSSLAMVATALALLIDAWWVDVLFWAAVAGSVLTLVNYARTARGLVRGSGSTPA